MTIWFKNSTSRGERLKELRDSIQKNWKRVFNKNVYTKAHGTSISDSQKVDPSVHHLRNRWTKGSRIVVSHKKMKVLIQATTWMHLKPQCWVKEARHKRSCIIWFHSNEKGKSRDRKQTSGCQGLGGRGAGEQQLNVWFPCGVIKLF